MNTCFPLSEHSFLSDLVYNSRDLSWTRNIYLQYLKMGLLTKYLFLPDFWINWASVYTITWEINHFLSARETVVVDKF